MFRSFNVSCRLYLLMCSASGAVVISALVIMIWQSRKRVAEAIGKDDAGSASDIRSLRTAFADCDLNNICYL